MQSKFSFPHDGRIDATTRIRLLRCRIKSRPLFLGTRIRHVNISVHLYHFSHRASSLDLDQECWKVLQVTAWVPLLDANRENGFFLSIFFNRFVIRFVPLGCLQILRGGHRPGVTCNHNCCVGGTWYVEVPEEEMAAKLKIPVNDQTVITCEVPFGSVIFFNNLIPHRSLENYSQNIRWSLDLRWYLRFDRLRHLQRLSLGKNLINRMVSTA